MIELDGGIHEGGGQILRTALALSVVTGTPFRMLRIRKNRPAPGLKHQHLKCIEALTLLSRSRASGAHLKAETVEFHPGQIHRSELDLDIGTAGSVTLLLQALLLPALMSGRTVRLRLGGGTDTQWSIPADYFIRLFLPFAREFAPVEVKELRRGFYPKGGGRIDLEVGPARSCPPELPVRKPRSSLFPIRLTEPPRIQEIKGISVASQELEKAGVARRQADGAQERIGERFPVSIRQEYVRTLSVGTSITLWAEDRNGLACIGGDALGERGVRAEQVGNQAACSLMEAIDSGAGIDRHLADNLIPILALVGGEIRPDRITGHIRANMDVCRRFLDAGFEVDPDSRLIRAEGAWRRIEASVGPDRFQEAPRRAEPPAPRPGMRRK